MAHSFLFYLKKRNLEMGQPKRKQSKHRSRKRRGANFPVEPQFAKDPSTGNLCIPHCVNPETGMYRGRQVLNVDK